MIQKIICALFGHKYKIVERDEEYGCHKYQCSRCDHIHQDEPYAGIGG